MGFKICKMSRHRSMQLLADHVRDAELFRDHASNGLLLVYLQASA